MLLNEQFQLVQVADEFLAVPVGDAASSSNVIVLNEAMAYLLQQMKSPKTVDELVVLLTDEYEVGAATAKKDIEEALGKLLENGVISE